jgi:hypothetical protein
VETRNAEFAGIYHPERGDGPCIFSHIRRKDFSAESILSASKGLEMKIATQSGVAWKDRGERRLQQIMKVHAEVPGIR